MYIIYVLRTIIPQASTCKFFTYLWRFMDIFMWNKLNPEQNQRMVCKGKHLVIIFIGCNYYFYYWDSYFADYVDDSATMPLLDSLTTVFSCICNLYGSQKSTLKLALLDCD